LSRDTWRGIWLAGRLMRTVEPRAVAANLHRYVTQDDLRALIEFPPDVIFEQANVSLDAFNTCFADRGADLIATFPLPDLRVERLLLTAKPPPSPTSDTDLDRGIVVILELALTIVASDEVTLAVMLSAESPGENPLRLQIADAASASTVQFSDRISLENVPAGDVSTIPVRVRLSDMTAADDSPVPIVFRVRVTGATNPRRWEFNLPTNEFSSDAIPISFVPPKQEDEPIVSAERMLAALNFPPTTSETNAKAAVAGIRTQLQQEGVPDPDRWLWARGVPPRFLEQEPAESKTWTALAEQADAGTWQRLRSLRSTSGRTALDVWSRAWVDWRIGAGAKPTGPPPGAEETADRWSLLLGEGSPSLIATHEKFQNVGGGGNTSAFAGRSNAATLDLRKIAEASRARTFGDFNASAPSGSGSTLLASIQRWKSDRVSAQQSLGTVRSSGSDSSLTFEQSRLMIQGVPGYPGGVYEFYGTPGNWRCLILRVGTNGSTYRLEDAGVSTFGATIGNPQRAVLVCPPPNMSDADFESMRSAISATGGEVTIAPCCAALGTDQSQNRWDNNAIGHYFYLVNPLLYEMPSTRTVKKFSR
ncbi:MAG: hypothetical protein AB7V46_21480, partial [Thermomicrobiales bacterium]